ncbi:uncharacterized protein F5147DRAFT_298969 [Suillus discolor]|uniref:Uncharacterized protein n=1 Tax=Suillus discolor TaxID=1912936 RepID=A0A9P7JYZ1_9AGAM|nr:uncharacterized protein F5147DRAFT_298969 [Suillus discolor]KAG2117023.1 hypothetical protein F5147DRAFT_298969 [Suillus discolor]
MPNPRTKLPLTRVYSLASMQKSGQKMARFTSRTPNRHQALSSIIFHISCPGSESAPYQLKDGDFVQLGVDYQGGMDNFYKSVRIQIEIGRDFTQPCSHVTNNELSSDHGGTNTHSQESRQEPGSCSSFIKGYISKGIALCAKHQLWDAMEAFDLALSSSNHNRMTVEILLIKAIALFNSSRHNEAIRRVQDLAAACQSSETLQCHIVDVSPTSGLTIFFSF